MEKALLTGATGFLGSYLLKLLLSKNYSVAILKRSNSNIERISNHINQCEIYDLDKISIKTIFLEFKPSLVLHTACCYGRNNDEFLEVVETNLLFGVNLLQEAIKNGVNTFINTDTLLPKTVSPYSLSKHQFSEWLKMNKNSIQIINFKIEHMFGIGDDKNKFVPWLIFEMINGSDNISLTSGAQRRDFIYIDDVVEAFSIVIDNKKQFGSFREFHIGTNEFIEVKKFVLMIASELELQTGKEIINRINFGVIPYRTSDVMIPVLDNSGLLELGWKPKISVKKGINMIINKSI